MSEVFRETDRASTSYNQMSELHQVSYLTLDGKYHVCGQDAVYYTDDNGTERFVEGGSCNGLTVDLYLTEDEWDCLMPVDDGCGPGFILQRYLDSLCERYEEIAPQECEQNMCVNGPEVQEHNDMETGKWNFPCFSADDIEEFADEMENLHEPNHNKETGHRSQSNGEVSKQPEMDQLNNHNHVMDGQRLWEDDVTIYWSESDLDEQLQLLGQTEMDHPNNQRHAAMKGQRLWEDDVTIYMSESDLDEQRQLLGEVPMLNVWEENVYCPVVKKATRLSRYDLYHGPVHYARSPIRPLIGGRGDSKERIVLDEEDCLESSMPLHTMAGARHHGKGVQKAAPRKKLLQASTYKMQSFTDMIVRVCSAYIGCSCWLLLLGLPSLCTVAIGLQKFGKHMGGGRQGQLHWQALT